MLSTWAWKWARVRLVVFLAAAAGGFLGCIGGSGRIVGLVVPHLIRLSFGSDTPVGCSCAAIAALFFGRKPTTPCTDDYRSA